MRPRDGAAGPGRMPRALLWCTAAIVASQAWPLSIVLPLLPTQSADSRSPSSDVLLGALPLHDAASRLDAMAASLPPAPGVVVAHGTSDELASAYMVITMRLWPRPVSYVACRPTPHLEQFRVPHAVPPPAWRLDVLPHDAAPLRHAATTTSDPSALCSTTPR